MGNTHSHDCDGCDGDIIEAMRMTAQMARFAAEFVNSGSGSSGAQPQQQVVVVNSGGSGALVGLGKARFCTRCGRALNSICLRCSVQNGGAHCGRHCGHEGEARFCTRCGNALDSVCLRCSVQNGGAQCGRHCNH